MYLKVENIETTDNSKYRFKSSYVLAATAVITVVGLTTVGVIAWWKSDVSGKPTRGYTYSPVLSNCNILWEDLTQSSECQCTLDFYTSKQIPMIKKANIPGSYFIAVALSLHDAATNLYKELNEGNCNDTSSPIPYLCSQTFNNSLCTLIMTDSVWLLHGLTNIKSVVYENGGPDVTGNNSYIILEGAIESYLATPALHSSQYYDNLEQLLVSIIYNNDICIE
jgi:hypothetical protein